MSKGLPPLTPPSPPATEGRDGNICIHHFGAGAMTTPMPDPAVTAADREVQFAIHGVFWKSPPHDDCPTCNSVTALLAAARADAEKRKVEWIDEYHKYAMKMRGERDALQARVAALEAALTRYGWHEGFCDRYRIFGEPSIDEPCSCGYAAALDPREP
jgi:hypothetical protein